MPAPKGNNFWEARSSHGRKPIFASPDDIWKAACEYFQWVEDNPLYESRVAQCKGEPKIMTLPKMRAMTIGGLCLFMDITETCYYDYRKREDFIRITKAIDTIIYNQKFEGASADLLNANIIARDLGLKDSTSNEHTGKDGAPLVDERELAARIAFALRKAKNV